MNLRFLLRLAKKQSIFFCEILHQNWYYRKSPVLKNLAVIFLDDIFLQLLLSDFCLDVHKFR